MIPQRFLNISSDRFKPMNSQEFTRIRRKLKMTPSDLADLTLTSTETIEAYESGLRPIQPTLALLMRELRKEKYILRKFGYEP